MTQQTYWNGDRNREAADFISSLVPTVGLCPLSRPALENWRRFSNGYYDIFNNGMANWDHVRPDFHLACISLGHEQSVFATKQLRLIIRYPLDLSPAEREAARETAQRLEEMADKLLARALAEHISPLGHTIDELLVMARRSEHVDCVGCPTRL